MVPVDLAHVAALEKALATAADLARHYGARVTYVGVTAATPGAVAHNPEEFAAKLAAFGEGEAAKRGHQTATKAVTSHDPAAELEDALVKAAGEIGADLVVMATHLPNIGDYIWPSNGGRMAQHSERSVFLVRPN